DRRVHYSSLGLILTGATYIKKVNPGTMAFKALDSQFKSWLTHKIDVGTVPFNVDNRLPLVIVFPYGFNLLA
ncbi:MAG TPA: hypothetical protein DCZ04_13455, partial [Syntrophorhabdus aromaticivorans]|nr:hypothetical protein [Syntrophorhabdus aromaticivorans]